MTKRCEKSTDKVCKAFDNGKRAFFKKETMTKKNKILYHEKWKSYMSQQKKGSESLKNVTGNKILQVLCQEKMNSTVTTLTEHLRRENSQVIIWNKNCYE